MWYVYAHHMMYIRCYNMWYTTNHGIVVAIGYSADTTV